MNAFRARTRPAVAAVAVLAVAAACGIRETPTRELVSMSGPPGSSSDVLERDEMTMAVNSMEELIRSRIPGVLVRSAGARKWVEIRGQGTIRSGSEALIIVDGVQNTTNGFLSMNPEDVQRIQVLKDGTAAIYGMRAANGVLVVTTRREGQ